MSDDVLNLLISEEKETIKLNNNYRYERNCESLIPSNFSVEDILKQKNGSVISNIDFNINSGKYLEHAGSNELYVELEHQIKLLNFKGEELNDKNSLFTDQCKINYNQKIQNQPNFQLNLEKIRIDDKKTNEFNENFYKQIRDSLDSHLKETENVINQLKQPHSFQTSFTTEPILKNDLFKNFSNSHSLIIDEKDIKYKINEDTNKKLKNFGESHFHQLRNSFKIIMDEKDKIINDRNFEINELRNESQCLKRKLSENTINSNQIETSETLAERMESYEELFNQIYNILREEGTKNEKLYVFNESHERMKENLKKKVDILINGLNHCLEDYKNKIENSEAAFNEVQKTLEVKINKCIQIEKDLIENCEKKCGIIRDEYDRLIRIKQDEIENFKIETDKLNSKIIHLKMESEKSCYSKEKEINKIKHHNDSLKIELESLNNEFNNLKNRFEYINLQEKQNHINMHNSIINLENENKKLNNKCVQLTTELVDYKQNNETLKDQINKYNQLIENLNERIHQEVLNKKEIHSSLEKVEQKLKKETNEKWEFNLKCKELEKRVDILQNDVIMHQNSSEIIKNLQTENQKNEQIQKQNFERIHQIQTLNENYQSKIKSQNQQITRIKSEKSEIVNELDEVRKKLENTESILDQLSKENVLIKQEKQTFDNILKDDLVKIITLKEEKEAILELNSKLKNQHEALNTDFESLKKKFQEKSNLYDSIFKEKEKLEESANFLENKVVTIENNLKAVTKNLSESITDKNLQISKLENSISLFEKETNLMRQYENLQKNQEDSKIIEFVMAIEQKMEKKKKKIENLKDILHKLEFENENLKKEKIDNQAMLNNANTEKNKFLNELKILKQKNSHFEKTLEKSARKYVDCEKQKEHLKNELIKFKKKLSDFNLIDEISKIHQQLNIGNDSSQNIRNNLVTLEKIYDLLFSSKMKSENLNIDIQNEEFCKVNPKIDSENYETENFDNEDYLKSSDLKGAVTLANIENGFNFLSLIGDELRKDANEVVEILKQ